MKILRIQLTFVVFLFYLLNLNAQYESIFGDTSTNWINITLFCDAAFVESFVHERDTLISETEYKIVNDLGMLRESEEKDQVWYRGFTDDEEILIMDLNLEVGQTFTINTLELLVDSVYLEDGLKVVQFDFDPPNCGVSYPLSFKERFGPTLGFQIMISGNTYERKLLRCYARDEEATVNLLNILGDDCFDDLTSTTYIERNDISLSPNPFISQINITFPTAEERKIVLIDISGKEIQTFNFSQENLEIKTDQIGSGIYFLKIFTGSETQIKKIIKLE